MKKQFFNRVAIYAVGVVILALGIDLTTRTGIGDEVQGQIFGMGHVAVVGAAVLAGSNGGLHQRGNFIETSVVVQPL